MAAPCAVKISLKFIDGTSETISHPIKPENGETPYTELLSSINAVQAQCNEVLTKFIEKEKGAKSHSDVKLQENESLSENGEDDEDEEDDDDDDGGENADASKEPPEKKPKT